jgi:hypothetical protein
VSFGFEEMLTTSQGREGTRGQGRVLHDGDPSCDIKQRGEDEAAEISI